MSQSSSLRRKFFEDGADAFDSHVKFLGLENIVPGGRWYPCPSCLNLFDAYELDETGQLTLEHVPPRSLGGVEILLTCRSCNNAAGTGMDSEAARWEKARRALTRQSRETIPGLIRMSGSDIEVNGALDSFPGRIEWVVNEAHNDPRRSAQFNSILLDRFKTEGRADLSFTSRLRLNEAELARAWIRTAYLCGFAVFGWPYAARKVMGHIRDIIDEPSAVDPPNYFFDAQAAHLRRRRIIVVDEPSDCQSVVFHWDGHVVVLPALRGGRPLDEIIAAMKQSNARPDLPSVVQGPAVPWPTRTSERYILPYI